MESEAFDWLDAPATRVTGADVTDAVCGEFGEYVASKCTKYYNAVKSN